MFKLCIFNKNVLILSMVLNFLLSGNTFAFADDKDILIFNNDYFLDSSSINQSNKNESTTISSTNTLNSQSQNVNFRSAHKYLGYTTAALSGITAASLSSNGFHDDTPHLCSPLVIKF